MGFRDRFYTPRTAEAILSWRIAVGVGVAVAMIVADLPIAVAIIAGLAVYGGLVVAAMPRSPKRPRIDAFAVGEPWRQYVQGARRAASKMHDTIQSTDEGPLKERLVTIGDNLDHGLDETWRIARRGDQIDGAIDRLDPTSLESKLGTLRAQADENPGEDLDAAIESVEGQLATADRLKEQSKRTANKLRLTQTRLDELVARAAEVSIGAGDTDAYEHDVEDLVIELEAVRQAVEAVNEF